MLSTTAALLLVLALTFGAAVEAEQQHLERRQLQDGALTS
jgi:hypothetical protein